MVVQSGYKGFISADIFLFSLRGGVTVQYLVLSRSRVRA